MPRPCPSASGTTAIVCTSASGGTHISPQYPSTTPAASPASASPSASVPASIRATVSVAVPGPASGPTTTR
ncbi:hypothetical protein ACFFX0_09635 [Citricoccus parietis]|uniref:Uncharacterized protein n=1 Tax=Citricoccus parietis TaxID=592307 RepID=A0ABV5FXN6_9MICC